MGLHTFIGHYHCQKFHVEFLTLEVDWQKFHVEILTPEVDW